MPVVGDQHQGALVVGEGGLEDVPAGDVEMVGRLVEEERVQWPDEELGHRQPGPLAPGEHVDPLLHVVAGEQEAPEQVAGADRGAGRYGGRHLVEEAVREGQRLVGVLREVCELGIVADDPLPALGLEHPGQELQQGRLAGAVGTDEGHLLVTLQRQVEPLVDGRGGRT